MSKIEIKTPALGESISEATVAKWLKKQNEFVKVDEVILELETEKVTLEVSSPATGILSMIEKNNSSTVKVGDILGYIEEGADTGSSDGGNIQVKKISSVEKDLANSLSSINLPPSVNRLVSENKIDVTQVAGTGKNSQITKGDVLNHMEKSSSTSESIGVEVGKEVERVKMSRLRKTIASRLKDSQNTAAILTTFNEIDMTNVMNLRAKYKDEFEKSHGVKLGFMSFFVKAVVNALKEIPAVNAEIEGDYIVYKNYYDIGVAVGTSQGLVVPVVRNCDKMSFSDLEKEIVNYGKKAKDGKLSIAELSGGTFTISNGGVYGSLLSTPIINPPQSGILGMHKIQERPIAIAGKVEIRPMMYLALSYDHRIIDGKEAVTFLIRVKQAIEDPERLLIGL